MNEKQIGAIILIIAGLIIGGYGLVNVIELSSLNLDNPLIKMSIAMSGTSISALWMKFGGMLAVGVLVMVGGIIMLKKQAVVAVKGE